MFVDFFIRRPVFATVCALLIILAGTVETAVTQPLEQQINGAEGMKYVTSSSSNDGSSQITATFDLNRNPDLAAVDIQNRVNTALGRLPAAVKTTGVTTTKASNNFVF